MTPDAAAVSIRERLGLIPPESDAAIIIRHAEREGIPAGEFGENVPLTARGIAAAERLGALLTSARPLVKAVSSPVPRCLETGRAIRRGGGQDERVTPDHRLGDPGPFVIAPDVAGQFFLEVGALELVRRQLSPGGPPPGMIETAQGVGILLGLAAGDLGRRGRLNLYVTHDSILAALAGYLFGLSADAVGWPGYLDGLLLWRGAGRLHFGWRGLAQASHPLGRYGDGL